MVKNFKIFDKIKTLNSIGGNILVTMTKNNLDKSCMTEKQLVRILCYSAYRYKSVFKEPEWFGLLINEDSSIGNLAKEIFNYIKSDTSGIYSCDKFFELVTANMFGEFVEFLNRNDLIHEYSHEDAGLSKEFIYNPYKPDAGIYYRRVIILKDDYPMPIIKVLVHSDRTCVICLLAECPEQVFCQTLFDMRTKGEDIKFSSKACSRLDARSYGDFLDLFTDITDTVFRFFEKDSMSKIS